MSDRPDPLVPAEVDLIEQLHREFERAAHVRPYALAIAAARDWRARLRAIERYYRHVQPDIDAAPCDEWAFDPYEVDWPRFFTPIEAALWSDIRQLGIPMYPQFPVETFGDRGEKTFFADFANPSRKVAVECDGKAFHDPALDRERDRLMQDAGWTVYRFTGSQCREDFNDTTLQRSTVARELERIARLHLGPIDPKAARRPFKAL